ncbi:MAG: hypothetical protein AAGA18_03275 [Verrucomicrobiota bacterium]
MEQDKQVLEIWLKQLERMRSMQYSYHKKFFTLISTSLVLFLTLILLPHSHSIFYLPFLVVSAGVQASFYLHFCDFARIHAEAIEKKINEMYRLNLLLGAELESTYFYDLKKPRISGFLLSTPFRFFSFFTLHWSFIWAAFFLIGVYQSLNALSSSAKWYYLGGLFYWAACNIGFIAYYFIKANDSKRIIKLLSNNLGKERV